MFDRINEGRWWDFGWQLVEGCTPVSPACKNCWSLAKEKRFRKETGVVFHTERLHKPWGRKKPAVYSIWNDLFHKSVDFNDILEVMFQIEKCPQHTFLILTKRPQRMHEFFTDWVPNPFWINGDYLPNVWLGVTAENQEQADKRIPILLDIPAAKRFVSVEPMLGIVSLDQININKDRSVTHNVLTGIPYDWDYGEYFPENKIESIDWVIAGAESGPGRRELSLCWIDDLILQCTGANVPLMVKQIFYHGQKIKLPEIQGRVWNQKPE